MNNIFSFIEKTNFKNYDLLVLYDNVDIDSVILDLNSISTLNDIQILNKYQYINSSNLDDLKFNGSYKNINTYIILGESELNMLENEYVELFNSINIKSIKIGKDFKYLIDFKNNDNLEEIIVNTENENFYSVNGCLYKDNSLIKIPNNLRNNNAKYHNHIIAETYAYDGCKGLLNISDNSLVFKAKCNKLKSPHFSFNNPNVSIEQDNIFYDSDVTSVHFVETYNHSCMGNLIYKDTTVIGMAYACDYITIFENTIFKENIILNGPNVDRIIILNQVAPTINAELFGNTDNGYIGRNKENKILYVPKNASGYEEGVWKDIICNPEICNFQLVYCKHDYNDEGLLAVSTEGLLYDYDDINANQALINKCIGLYYRKGNEYCILSGKNTLFSKTYDQFNDVNYRIYYRSQNNGFLNYRGNKFITKHVDINDSYKYRYYNYYDLGYDYIASINELRFINNNVSDIISSPLGKLLNIRRGGDSTKRYLSSTLDGSEFIGLGGNGHWTSMSYLYGGGLNTSWLLHLGPVKLNYIKILICDRDNNLIEIDGWDRDNNAAIGIYVEFENIKFIIYKTDISGEGTSNIFSGGTYEVYNSYEQAITDINGALNSNNYTSDTINLCINYIFEDGSKGYLGSAGEWAVCLAAKDAINKALTLINGDILDGSYWTSTCRSKGSFMQNTASMWYVSGYYLSSGVPENNFKSRVFKEYIN